MKLRVLSDLHLEFSNGNMEVPELSTDSETVLVLAGDVGLAKRSTTYKYFIEDVAPRFRAVVMILGNHEFYRDKFLTAYEKMWTELVVHENVHLLEKESITFDDVTFVCATLWTSMDNHNSLVMMDANITMNDYSEIRHGPKHEPWKRTLSPKDTVEDHLNARHFVFEQIKVEKEKGNKVVVVTHHAPSFQSISDEFKGDGLNGAYATELFEHIMELEDAQPELWCHGHLHSSNNYMIGKTRVLCNPRGYDTGNPMDLNPEFNVNLVIEV